MRFSYNATIQQTQSPLSPTCSAERNNFGLIGRSEESCFIPFSSEVDPPWAFIYVNSPEVITIRKGMTIKIQVMIRAFKSDYEKARVERIITYVKLIYFSFMNVEILGSSGICAIKML